MIDVIDVLKKLNPAELDYQEWVNVGMALKSEGYSVDDWDSWSRRDSRYKQGECFRKWQGFSNNKTSSYVSAGTIIQYAKNQGISFPEINNYALDWESTISDEYEFIDTNYLEEEEVREPVNFSPIDEIKEYLGLVFEPNDYVGYVTSVYDFNGELKPTKGSFNRRAKDLIKELNHYDDIGYALGDYNDKVGAWIRFNPLDGNGIKNENVVDFRYALVESDNLSIGKQVELMKKLELPIRVLVHSGNKSVHAIVKIDANNFDEYRKRVEYLYKICEKNGLSIDKQNRNPSRLSRMPGFYRNGKKQFIIDKNLGKTSWNEWYEWIEGINDDLPEPESLKEALDRMPDLSPCLIDGILRQGHKMLLAGPSKAGKSFLLIQLAIAIAEGTKWLGFSCAKGRVMYVNLELDRASCLHRFKDVYKAMGIVACGLNNIDIWNLRGRSVPMDKLAPKLIRRARDRGYMAVIIDPIYKVLTGDENSADQMAHFTNQFDKIATELGCAVIYCHHHSKGLQGSKRAADRSSGSGVFARDPDALLDLIELKLPEELEKNDRTGWRLEATLREFKAPKPIDVFFEYPIHTTDELGLMEDLKPESEKAPWQRGIEARKTSEDRKNDRVQEFDEAYHALNIDGKGVSKKDFMDYLDISEKTLKRRLKESGKYKNIAEQGFMAVYVQEED